MRFLVIQHAACEPPGAYEQEMHARGIGFERVQAQQGTPLPHWHCFDAIVVMGGPMGAGDELPWLLEEKRSLTAALHAGLPYWGVCLGAQLLAACLGARVYRGERPEIGIYSDVALTPAGRRDPVFAGMPARLTTLQWHADSFELPPGARLLASSRAYANQAFAWGPAYALQFHLEVCPELAATWLELPSYAAELTRACGPAAPAALARELHELHGATPVARRLFGSWIENVVARSARRAPPGARSRPTAR